MIHLLDKYEARMISHGLADAENRPLMGGLDAEIEWNRPGEAAEQEVLAALLEGLGINSILYCRPAEPYATIIDYLAARAEGGAIRPEDCETRTFMHDIPVLDELETGAALDALGRRKSAVVRGGGILSWGRVSPEQAYIFFSSVCFASFVKFFTDHLRLLGRGGVDQSGMRVYERVTSLLSDYPDLPPPEMARAPFDSEAGVYEAIAEAGRLTVEYDLVDSFFGNVSLRWGDTLYISQTTSSLDELEGCIDPCPLDDSSCSSITASSEFTAHRLIIGSSGCDAVLHGHPRFSVILSMICDKSGVCPVEGDCHRRCPEARSIEDVPIVPGEVGTGRYGLCNTLPPAIRGRRGAIVYGHGLFTTGRRDLAEAFESLLSIERMCREIYFARAGEEMKR